MNKKGWITKLVGLRFFLAGFEAYCIVPTVWVYLKSLGQTKFFLSLVISAYDIGAIISGPLFGFITDLTGNPRCIFISCCAFKTLGYVLYSINLSGYFPLFGRLLTGLGSGGQAILLGQIALQTDEESRGKYFVFFEGVYCIGSTFGPAIGGFIIFHGNILGWEINDGNSPGIVLTIIWLIFLFVSLLIPSSVWIQTGASNVELTSNSITSENEKGKASQKKLVTALWDSRVLCLLFILLCNKAFLSSSTFYVPILASDHFHLKLIHTKLLFLNCTLFTLMIFLALYLVSKYVEERKLFVFALFLQIIATSFLTILALSWDQVHDFQYYILLLYICFGMPYFAYPFGNSILSKITDPENATFIQGLSYANIRLAVILSRVVVSFVFSKMSLLLYCFGMTVLWLAGIVWYAVLYKKMVSNV